MTCLTFQQPRQSLIKKVLLVSNISVLLEAEPADDRVDPFIHPTLWSSAAPWLSHHEISCGHWRSPENDTVMLVTKTLQTLPRYPWNVSCQLPRLSTFTEKYSKSVFSKFAESKGVKNSKWIPAEIVPGWAKLRCSFHFICVMRRRERRQTLQWLVTTWHLRRVEYLLYLSSNRCLKCFLWKTKFRHSIDLFSCVHLKCNNNASGKQIAFRLTGRLIRPQTATNGRRWRCRAASHRSLWFHPLSSPIIRMLFGVKRGLQPLEATAGTLACFCDAKSSW